MRRAPRRAAASGAAVVHPRPSDSSVPRRPRSIPAWCALLPLLLLLVAAGAAGAADRTAGRTAERIDLVPPDAAGRLPVVIETADAAGLAARIAAVGGTVEWVFENIEAVSALVPAEAMPALLADPATGNVHRQRWVRRAIVAPELPDLPGRSRPRIEGGPIVPLRSAEGARVRPLDAAGLAALVDGAPARGTAPVSFLGYDELTGAADAWEIAGLGEGVVVAIIDTGIFPDHPLIEGNVIGGMNLVPAAEEQAIDLDGDDVPDGRSFDWDAVENNGHGTFVAGLVAGHARLDMPEDDPFVQSVLFHSPGSVELDGEGGASILLAGSAPGASLWAMKVFPYDGSGAPDARVAAAIDRLISMRRSGELDVDVINMSLSGPVLFDGWNPLDLTVAKATFFGITVVSAASNDGPALVSVGSPASAITGIAAGATLDPIHTRVAIESLFGQGPGFGNLVYPHDALMVTDFSSRGLTADHRLKPDLVASGFLVFSSTLVDVTGDGVNDVPSFGFSSGTSFASPTVAGCAALVTAYGDALGGRGRAPFVENVMKRAGVPIAPRRDVSEREQGRGFVNVPAALELLEHGHMWSDGHGHPEHHGLRRLNLASGSVSGTTPELAAGETYHFLVRIPDGVSAIDLEVGDVVGTGMPNPVVGDDVLVTVHSAKRGGSGDYVWGGALAAGESADPFAWPWPEPGVARVTMTASFPNGGGISAGFSMTAHTDVPAFDDTVERDGCLRRDGTAEHVVTVPEGLDAVAIRLSWKHDWTRFPTYDLDMLVDTPDGVFPVATIDSPEIAWIESPPAGEWTFRIADLGTVLRREPYELFVGFLEDDIRTPVSERFEGDRARIAEAGPNPFVQSTEVQFALPKDAPVRVTVHDVAGRVVRTLVDEPMAAGDHLVPWDGRGDDGRRIAAGVYFLRLRTEAGTSTRKVVKVD